MWTALALTAALAASPAEVDPFQHLEAMLASVPEAPASVEEAAWKGLVDRLEAARKAGKDAEASCHWTALQAVGADGAELDLVLADEQNCLRKARPAPKGKASKVDKAKAGSNLMMDEGPGTVVRVFYGTDRTRDGEGYGGAPRCGADAAPGSPDCLDVGVVEVNIPDTHKFGEVESEMPPMWVFTPNPAQHLFVVGTDRLDEAAWTAAVKADLAKADRNAAFVYIHGYNNSFDAAAMRAAQMTYDLKFPGVPMMYSWGSAGTLPGYFADEEAVKVTVPHLRAFLERTAKQAGVSEMHIVAHSMGNRAIHGLLASMDDQGKLDGVKVASLILAAPDVDAEVFKNEVVPRLSGLTDHAELYVNEGDKALLASKLVHGDKPRAGAVRLVADGIETIDATKVGTDMLGHAYFGSVPALLDDILATWSGKRPPQREWLDDAGTHWTFE